MSNLYIFRLIFCFSIIISFIPNYSKAAPLGVVWTSQTVAGEIDAVAWGRGKFVAVGYDRVNAQGLITTSADGVTWVQANFGLPISLIDIVWTGSMFVVLGNDATKQGHILTSPDGLTWSSVLVIAKQHLQSITWNGTLLVAVGFDSTPRASSYSILTSNDGFNWTKKITPKLRILYDVVWNGTQFIVFGTFGLSSISLISPNGIAWTEWNTALDFKVSDSVWDGNQVVAVGSNITGSITGRSSTTTDGVRFSTLQTFPFTTYVGYIVWTGTQFVAVGGSGAIMTSPDGTTWTQQTSGVSDNFTGIAWNGSKLVAVGVSGTIATSQATLPPPPPPPPPAVGGGGCSIRQVSSFDPTLIAMLILSFGYLARKWQNLSRN